MNAPAPVHPPVKVARTDSYDHSFWRDAGRWLGASGTCAAGPCGGGLCHPHGTGRQSAGRHRSRCHGGELVPDLVAPAEERVSEEVQPETTLTEQPEEVQPEPEPGPQPEAKAEPQQVQEPEEVIPHVVEAQEAGTQKGEAQAAKAQA